MSPSRLPARLLLLVLALASLSAHAADAQGAGEATPVAPASADSFLDNGGFEADADGDGRPDAWPLPGGATWESEGGNRFIRLQSPGPNQPLSVQRLVPIPAGTEALAFSCRVRYAEVKRGAEPWHDARILLEFKDAMGRTVKPGPPHPHFTGSAAAWKAVEIRCAVPPGAVSLSVMPALLQARSGRFEFDDLALAPITAAQLAAAQAASAAAAAAAAAGPEVQVDGGEPPPPPLHVEGPRLLDAAGNAVWLQGVNVPSLEWSNAGEGVLASMVMAIDTWKANVIRLPVHAERWSGRHKDQSDGGAAYRALVDRAVTVAASRGAYLILDLHHFRAPDQRHVEFWRAAAVHYRDHPAVLFGLFNEPHGIDWETWRNGGLVQTRKAPAKDGKEVLAENAEVVADGFQSPGIQGLVDAVRQAGARNVLLAGGRDWAYDISGVLTGFALDDRGGNGIVYDTHVYPWKGNWRERFLAVAAHHPVLLGEVGCDSERMPFVPPERHEDPFRWAPDMLGCIQEHRLHWTAWSFHPAAKPALILERTTFAPTPYWGDFVRRALAGERFTSQRLR